MHPVLRMARVNGRCASAAWLGHAAQRGASVRLAMDANAGQLHAQGQAVDTPVRKRLALSEHQARNDVDECGP
jgi:hypothetical protein